MHSEGSAYGLWTLVVINVAIFVGFAFSFWHPKTRRDWRAFGAFAAFIIALFTEMYGFPLTIYLLSGWLGRRYPGIDLLSHDFRHFWIWLSGWKGDPHLSPFHIASDVLIAGGFIVMSSAWRVLHEAQTSGRVATTGAYSYVRHPQYTALIAIVLGFLLQWPTLVTLIMFPILTVMYMRLAYREEREARQQFGETYARYAVPSLSFSKSSQWLVAPRALRGQ
jgi:protein-S-isoprenylcysteine O-methyltransferase Ste14